MDQRAAAHHHHCVRATVHPWLSFPSVSVYFSEVRSLVWIHKKRPLFASTLAGEESALEDRLYLYVILSKRDFQTDNISCCFFFLSWMSFFVCYHYSKWKLEKKKIQ